MGTQHHPTKGRADMSGFTERRDARLSEEARSFRAEGATLRAILEDTADFLRHLRVSDDQKVAVDAQVAAIEQVLTSPQNPRQ